MVILMSRFDEHRVRHHPLTQSWHGESFTAVGRTEALAPDAPPLDQVIVRALPGRVRLAALDPALSRLECCDQYQVPARAGACLHHGEEIHSSMVDANAVLHHPGRGRSTGQMLCAAAAAEWDPEAGELVAVQAADVEVWARTHGNWVRVFDADMLTASSRARWDAEAAPFYEREAHLRSHDELLGEPKDWACAPLGQFSQPRLRSMRLDGVDAVAVATDGVEIDESTLALLPTQITQLGPPLDATITRMLDAKWEQLHARPDEWPHPHPHGDLAIVLAVTTRQ